MTIRSTRFEKVDWLLENCAENFIKECPFLFEMIGWMSEEDFDEFHEHVCRNWNINSPFVETDEEEENEFIVEDDEIIPVRN